MADTKEVSAEAAKALVEAILKQSELLGSWSLAVFGAAILLIVWYVQRLLDQAAKPPPLRGWYLIVIAVAFEGASILLMYFAYGKMVNLIPELQFTRIDNPAKFYDFLKGMHSFNVAQWLFFLQFWTFFLGIVSLGIFGLCNLNLLRLASASTVAPPKPSSNAPAAPPPAAPSSIP
jgi:hypothetical protein